MYLSIKYASFIHSPRYARAIGQNGSHDFAIHVNKLKLQQWCILIKHNLQCFIEMFESSIIVLLEIQTIGCILNNGFTIIENRISFAVENTGSEKFAGSI